MCRHRPESGLSNLQNWEIQISVHYPPSPQYFVFCCSGPNGPGQVCLERATEVSSSAKQLWIEEVGVVPFRENLKELVF